MMTTAINLYPRLRAGGDIIQRGESCLSSVSIHASVQEATGIYVSQTNAADVSIHASVQEATCRVRW